MKIEDEPRKKVSNKDEKDPFFNNNSLRAPNFSK
jgi:hypothetical protein